MKIIEKLILPVFVFAFLAMAPEVAEAQNCNKNPDHPRCQTDPGPGPDPDPGLTPIYYDWMHPDVGAAFNEGYTGQGSHLVILDNFSGTTYLGNLDGTSQSLTHGGWTSLQSRLVAPGASWTDVAQPSGRKDRSGLISDHYSSTAGLQVVNLSFGLFDPEGTVVDANYSFGYSIWDSLADEAWNPNGEAVFVKAAGNLNGQTVDQGTIQIGFPIPTPHVDTLNLALIGAPNALFVGALDASGSIASYSTIAGDNQAVQDMYLVVTVRDDLTGLAGTSFAAPIVSGYSAIIGDKYQSTLVGASNPAELVVDRLLDTALDTFQGYNVSVHGQGQACLSCALSPNTIPN